MAEDSDASPKTPLATEESPNARLFGIELDDRCSTDIGHDLNNALTVINGCAELLCAHVPVDDLSWTLADRILEAGRHAADIVAQHAESGRLWATSSPSAQLNDLVDDMADTLRRVVGDDILLETNLDPSLWPLDMDVNRIGQLLVNLALNARDEMPYGGRIRIETNNTTLDRSFAAGHPEVETGQYVLLAVSDNGSGPFHAGHRLETEPYLEPVRDATGAGFGLATVAGIVKQHRGHLWIISEPGEGTTVHVYFPRASGSEGPQEVAPARPEMPRGNETILLVEDDQSMRDVARQVLQGQGYVVLEAKDGQEALQIAAAFPGVIHLLVTDVVMPGVGGRQLSHMLAQRRAGLVSLFVSGYADRAIVQHGMLDADAPFLQKPFSPFGLASTVRELLDANRGRTNV